MEDSDQQPRNRKERRAAAREANKANKGKHLDQSDAPFKLAQPDRSGPKGKTLYEIAEERQKQLEKEGFYKEQEKRDKERRQKDGDWEFDDDPLGAFGEAVFYSSALTMGHFTLDVLVFNQYRQEIEWKEIFSRAGTFLPVIFVIVYILHTETALRFKILRNLGFLGTAIAAGCYLVFSGNKHGYYAVMKRAPPVGTIWIWSVVEMNLVYAVVSVVAVFAYSWWNGFTTF